MPLRHRPFNWNSPVVEAIERRVARHRSALAAQLELEDTEEIDAVCQELEQVCLLSLVSFREVDEGSSVAAQRRELKSLLELSESELSERYTALSPAAQVRMILHYPNEPWELLTGQPLPTPKALRQGAAAAVESLPAPKRGRPHASDSIARQHFAFGLARVFASAKGQPTRRYRSNVTDAGKREYGPFKDFVAFVIGRVPPRFLRRRAGLPVSVDELVRTGIELHRRFPNHDSIILPDEIWASAPPA